MLGWTHDCNYTSVIQSMVSSTHGMIEFRELGVWQPKNPRDWRTGLCGEVIHEWMRAGMYRSEVARENPGRREFSRAVSPTTGVTTRSCRASGRT